MDDRRTRARRSLEGLSVGDGFGERFFVAPQVVDGLITQRATPASPWTTTDDTEMACVIVAHLDRHGRIHEDALALDFARRHAKDPMRGYGGGAHQVLAEIHAGIPWRVASPALFDGGSFGNGGAMRSAPIGAFFADDLARVVDEARRSAVVTHAHPEGQAGAIAVAVAAALVEGGCEGGALLAKVAAHTPEGETRQGIVRASELRADVDPRHVAAMLGSGARVSSMDTVPFALWCAARHVDDFVEAMWTTVSGLGDRDTTCAIVGGVVGLRSPPPASWLAAREPLH